MLLGGADARSNSGGIGLPFVPEGMARRVATTRRLSDGASLLRKVTGTIAASSARYGISMPITSVPSFIGRLLKTSCTSPGQGS